MSFILFLHLLFGLWFAYQIYRVYSKNKALQKFIKPCIFSYLILLLLLTQLPTTLMILGIYIPIIVWILAEWILQYYRKKVFRSQFLSILDSTIAGMKTGHSFRESFSFSIESLENQFLKRSFSELKERMIYAQKLQNSSDQRFFALQILCKADQDSQPISYLECIRHSLKIEKKFQEKASATLMSIRIQSFVMILMYISLLFFVIFYYGFKTLWLISLSFFLFFIGTIISFQIGKKIKWTI